MAGETVQYLRASRDYTPVDDWVLTLYLAGPSVLNVTATDDGTNFIVTLSAADTTTLSAGGYTWREIVVKGAEKHVIGAGDAEVEANVITAAAGDLTSHEDRVIALLEAKIEGKFTTDMERVQVGNRVIARIPIEQCVRYLSKMKAQKRANSRGLIESIPIRIKSPWLDPR